MEFVDLETAKAARGVRIVSSTVVPSPWSEAAKATFTLADIPFVAVRAMPRDAAIHAWTKAHNVPVVFHDDEPPRTVWSQIVALAARLAGPGRVLPVDLDRRMSTIGILHEIAGEDGLGWNARLLMIHASLTSDGARGFARPAAQYLAAKYGYAADRIDHAGSHARDVLAMLAARLGDAAYFGGDRPDALDAYAATFLTPLPGSPSRTVRTCGPTCARRSRRRRTSSVLTCRRACSPIGAACSTTTSAGRSRSDTCDDRRLRRFRAAPCRAGRARPSGSGSACTSPSTVRRFHTDLEVTPAVPHA